MRRLWLVLLVACSTPESLKSNDDQGASPEPAPCDPPLAMTPAEAFTNPLGLVTFNATGGTGAYVFELASESSDAFLQEVSGAYLAGSSADRTDTVRITDLGCAGDDTTLVHVVPSMMVRP